MTFPKNLEALIETLANLPGIGHKTAEKFAFFLLKRSEERKKLSEGLAALEHIAFCPQCFYITPARNPALRDNVAGGQEKCPFCDDPRREKNRICILSDFIDLWSMERTHEYKGLYHILGGVIHQIEGIGPDKLHIQELEERIKKGGIEEVILATDPDMAGETTALYIKKLLSKYPVKITRLARGLPMGATLEYADEVTLSSALKGRVKY